MPVYFIGRKSGKGAIKIGATKNVQERLRQLQRYSPVPVVLLGVFPGGVEVDIQNHFKHLRMYGEWFKDTPELRKFIAAPYPPNKQHVTVEDTGDLIDELSITVLAKNMDTILNTEETPICPSCGVSFMVIILFDKDTPRYCPYCGSSL